MGVRRNYLFHPVLVSVSLIALSACGKKPAAAAVSVPEPQAAAAAVESAPPSAATEASSETAQAIAPANPGGGGGGRQGGGNPEERAKQRMEQMQASLGLTADQTQKLTAIFQSQRPAIEALRNDRSLSREQRREKMQELRKANEPQVAAILTPEQMTKWEAERKQRQERMGGRQGGKDRPAASPSPAN